MKQSAFLDYLVSRIAGVVRGHPVRVGIDGVDGVGKTRLADGLVQPLARLGRPVIRASIDGFHNPRHVRYRRGRRSPEGYFRDSFNYDALTSELLSPLGPAGALLYRRAVFDYRVDSEVDRAVEKAASTAVLLFDGVFLHRPELLEYWDLSVFLEAPFDVTVRRLTERDGYRAAGILARYVNGQTLYLRECEPRERATIVVDYRDSSEPVVLRD